MAETPSVAVGFVDNSTVEGLFADCLAELARRWPTFEIRRVQSGPNISRARNRVVRELRRTDAEWFLLPDTDMVWPPDAIEQLFTVAFAGQRPVVSGLHFAVGYEGIYPTVYMRNEQGNFDRLENIDLGGSKRVDAVGGAFLLVHRDVFDRIEEMMDEQWEHGPKHPLPWFEETYSPTGQRRSEDITFCVRVADAGFEIWVNTKLDIGHIKKQTINLDYYTNWVQHHRLVVTGTPRSGTKYVQQLLAGIGLGVSHETVYTTINPKPWGMRRGEVSWMAAPNLAQFHGIVAHLVRNPLAVLNSLMGIGFFHQPEGHYAWADFIQRQGIYIDSDNPLDTGQRFIMEWNRRIEPYAHRRIKVEELGYDDLMWMCLALDARPARMILDRVFEAVPTDANSRHRADITWSATRPDFREFAREYGYSTDG